MKQFWADLSCHRKLSNIFSAFSGQYRAMRKLVLLLLLENISHAGVARGGDDQVDDPCDPFEL